MKQEKLYRHILEAMEADKLVTEKVNLRSKDMMLSRAIKQLRQADFIDGIFHDIVDGSVMIEGVPLITLKGQEYLDELRSKFWRSLFHVIAIVWAVITGLSSVIAGVYYWYHLHS